jgi:hypothetical protein
MQWPPVVRRAQGPMPQAPRGGRGLGPVDHEESIRAHFGLAVFAFIARAPNLLLRCNIALGGGRGGGLGTAFGGLRGRIQ